MREPEYRIRQRYDPHTFFISNTSQFHQRIGEQKSIKIMRKRLLIFGLFVIGLLASTIHAATKGTTFTVDGIRYEVTYDGTYGRLEVKVISHNGGTANDSGGYSGKVIIPEKVTYDGKTYDVCSIGEYAFNSDVIDKLVIPKSVSGVGGGSFRDCIIEELVISDGTWPLSGNHKYRGEYLRKSSYEYPYTNTKVYKLYLGREFDVNDYQTNGRTNFGYMAPLGHLKSLVIGPHVEEITWNMDLSDCPYLETVEVSADNKVLRYENNVLLEHYSKYGENYDNLLLYLPKKVASVTTCTIPNTVRNIEENAFAGCANLTEVEIPTSVEFIKWNAFDGCANLTEIVLPTSIRNINRDAFANCPNLKYAFITASPTMLGDLYGEIFPGFAGTMVLMTPKFGDGFFKGVSNDATIYAHRSYFEKIRKSYTGSNLFAVEDYVEMTELKQLLTRISFKI